MIRFQSTLSVIQTFDLNAITFQESMRSTPASDDSTRVVACDEATQQSTGNESK